MSADKPEIVKLAETFTKPGVLNRLIVLMMTTWGERDPQSSVSQHPASYVATFADMARAIVADGVVAEEPEWEEGIEYGYEDFEHGIIPLMTGYERIEYERPVRYGRWVPVKQEGAET